MPRFYQEVEAEVEINADEFISYCTKKEIQELISCLSRKGYISGDTMLNEKCSIFEKDYIENCIKLSSSYYQLTNEDCETIKKIANKL
jgi:hypothetical protein